MMRSTSFIAQFPFGLQPLSRNCFSGLWLLLLSMICADRGLSQQPVENRPGQVTALQWAQQMEQGLVSAIGQAEKSVVAIARVRKETADGRKGAGPEDPLRKIDPLGKNKGLGFDRLDPMSPEFVPNQYFTGVVVDRQGMILTTYHTLGDPAENDYYVWVRRRPYKVVSVARAEKVMAADPWTDLAVLRIKADDLVPIRLGNAEKLKKGMIVIGLGNPYAIARDGEVSASWGIIANLRRQAAPKPKSFRGQTERETIHHFGTLIQTDAKLNLGTSGGALINLRGEMIGLLTSQAALYGYEKSAGYAIPVDAMFQRTLKTLKAGKKVQVGFLGVAPEDLTAEWRQRGRFGAKVEHVVPGTPADHAGLKMGDIVTHVNQQRIENRIELFRQLGRLPVGAQVALQVERGGSLQRRGRVVSLKAVLTKKYVETARKAYAQQPDPTWRGLQVDYSTALPPEVFQQNGYKIDPKGCVAVVSVEADSPSWNAGLRPGEFISYVGKKRVATPEDFLRVASQQKGAVRLKLTVGQGDQAYREVAAP